MTDHRPWHEAATFDRPHFGGHVERLIGTTMGAVHLLRGTTFSSIKARGDYPAEVRATMTLRELERWLALEILGKYHHRVHSALRRPPIAAWSELTASTPARMPKERLEFLAGLLPYQWRMPRRDGVHLFGIRYWSDALVSLPGRHEQKLITRYDPRDLSRVWVRRSDGRHVGARYKNLAREPISLWEHSRAMERLREQGRGEVTEEILFRTIREQRRVEDETLRSSKPNFAHFFDQAFEMTRHLLSHVVRNRRPISLTPSSATIRIGPNLPRRRVSLLR